MLMIGFDSASATLVLWGPNRGTLSNMVRQEGDINNLKVSFWKLARLCGPQLYEYYLKTSME